MISCLISINNGLEKTIIAAQEDFINAICSGQVK